MVAVFTGIVAFATDTVYGLGVPVGDSAGLDRLYDLKQRPASQPMQLLVADRTMASHWVIIDDQPLDPATRIYPIRPDTPLDPRLVQHGGIGIRRPDHPPLIDYLRRLGVPLVATSANLRDAPPMTDEHQIREAFPDVPVVVTGRGSGRPSPIWNMRTSPPTRLR